VANKAVIGWQNRSDSDKFCSTIAQINPQKSMIEVAGILQAGHGVASGQAPDRSYEAGTIALQSPHFLRLGLDLSPYFAGTLNISIVPYRYQLLEPSYTFRNLQWHPRFPPEDFSFAPCQFIFQHRSYDGLIYYPHPETKIDHFQDPSIVEVLAPKVPDLVYGDRVWLVFDPDIVQVWELGQ
jgi:hypothetical protein